MGWLSGSNNRENRRRRRSELITIGLVGLIGYLAVQAVGSGAGRMMIWVALFMSAIALLVAIGLLVRRMNDPVAKERLAGLVQYAKPRIPHRMEDRSE